MVKVIIADDHAIVRKGLDLYIKFQDDIQLVGEANNGKELCQMLQSKQTDVVLLDIDMPKMNGITALRSLTDAHPTIRFLIMSMHPEEIYGPTVGRWAPRVTYPRTMILSW